jgi:hypothetical protein
VRIDKINLHTRHQNKSMSSSDESYEKSFSIVVLGVTLTDVAWVLEWHDMIDIAQSEMISVEENFYDWTLEQWFSYVDCVKIDSHTSNIRLDLRQKLEKNKLSRLILKCRTSDNPEFKQTLGCSEMEWWWAANAGLGGNSLFGTDLDPLHKYTLWKEYYRIVDIIEYNADRISKLYTEFDCLKDITFTLRQFNQEQLRLFKRDVELAFQNSELGANPKVVNLNEIPLWNRMTEFERLENNPRYVLQDFPLSLKSNPGYVSQRFPPSKPIYLDDGEKVRYFLDPLLVRQDENPVESSVKEDCCVCFNSEKTVVFFPCRHVCTCEKCSSSVNVCPICQAKIRETVKVFMCYLFFMDRP